MKLFPALSLVLFACETFALPSPGTGSSNEPSKTRPFVLPPITPGQTTQAPFAQDASNAPRPFVLARLSKASIANLAPSSSQSETSSNEPSKTRPFVLPPITPGQTTQALFAQDASNAPRPFVLERLSIANLAPIAPRPKSLNNVKLNSQQSLVIAPKPTETQEKIAQDARIRPPRLPRLNQAPIANPAPSSSKTETLPVTPPPKSQKLNAMFGGQQPPIISPKPTDASKFEDIPLTVIGCMYVHP